MPKSTLRINVAAYTRFLQSVLEVSTLDKYEYKIRSDEIKSLVEDKNYKRAAEIADTIDWRRVKSVLMLCTISDIYKMVRRYEDSKALLLLAYEKREGSRMIVYALTELCVKLNDVVHAWEYYKEFCQIAEDDNRKYVLLYKIYVAQDVSLEEQIKTLEMLKEKEYTERWAYELAYLYHRIGFATKCVEECDEIILWFGEGKYVRKAMELKMLHEPLTPKQQALYHGVKKKETESGETKVIPNLDAAIMKEVAGMDPTMEPTIEFPAKDLEEIQVKTVDVGSQYNTIDLQKALAASMAELLEKSHTQQTPEDYDAEEQADIQAEAVWQAAPIVDTGEIPQMDSTEEQIESGDELGIQRTQEMPHVPDLEDVFFEDPATGDMSKVAREISSKMQTDDLVQLETIPKAETAKNVTKIEAVTEEKTEMPTYEAVSNQSGISKVIIPTKTGAFKYPEIDPTEFAEQKSEFDDILSQESDGQISLVVPEKQVVEKQITGQLSIQDILNEWENLKKQKEEKLKEDVKKRVLEQTGDIFAEFDQATRDGLLEQLQKKSIIAEEKERVKAEAKEAEERKSKEKYSPSEAYAEKNSNAKNEKTLQESVRDHNLTRPVADRQLTQTEKELFDAYIQSKHTRAQLLQALELMSLAPFTGNMLVSGEMDADIGNFAKNLVQYMKLTDHNFSGKAAKISGKALNKKSVNAVLDKMKNGALIVEEAGALNCSTAENIVKSLQYEERGLFMILVDTRGAIDSLLEVNQVLREPFNARVDIEALNDAALVTYGKKYAYEKEYTIDEMGMLALHTRISDMQTMEHAVTVGEVRQIIKNAIVHANKKNMKHFWDIFFGKRYDEEDMIILREKDFLMNT